MFESTLAHVKTVSKSLKLALGRPWSGKGCVLESLLSDLKEDNSEGKVNNSVCSANNKKVEPELITQLFI